MGAAELSGLDQFEGKSLAGTDGGFFPVFSPDGQWILYSTAQNKLKAMAVLRSKLLQMKQDEADAERSGIRKNQIGSGTRIRRRLLARGAA